MQEDLQKLQDLVVHLVGQLEDRGYGLDDWIDQRTAERLTGLKSSALRALRQQDLITWSQFGSKQIFYRRSDLIRFLDQQERKRA